MRTSLSSPIDTATRNQSLIVFSDLDGTLLDHETYSFAEAEPVLKQLKRQETPLILASSKTAAEIAPLRKEIGFEHCPSIVENGAGLLPPNMMDADRYQTHDDLLSALEMVPTSIRSLFRGISEMDISEISRQTGLSSEQAARAAKRSFSEPGLFNGSSDEMEMFISELHKRGITARRGGRFLTLSFGADKAARMQEVIDHFSGLGFRNTTILALGDAPNDIEMLRNATFGVIIPNPAHGGIPPLPEEETGQITRADLPGPAGWARSVEMILDLMVNNSKID